MWGHPPIPIWRVNSAHGGPLTNVSSVPGPEVSSRSRSCRRPGDLRFRAKVLNDAPVIPVVTFLVAKHDEVVRHGRGLVRQHERFPELHGVAGRSFSEVDVIHIRSTGRRRGLVLS